MRRLARLRQASSLLYSHSPPPPVSCHARCLAAQSSNFSTSRPRPLKRDSGVHPLDAATATESAHKHAEDPAIVEPAELLAAEADAEAAEATDYSEIETDLTLPPPITEAPRPKAVTDPSYTPAIRGAELEEVGGLEGWWERDGHWSGTLGFEPFYSVGGSREKVRDAVALEAIVRRAVVEALAVRGHAGGGGGTDVTLASRWRVGGRSAAVRALGAAIEVSEDGEARILGSAAELVGDLVEPADAAMEETATLDVGEAAEIAKSWDASWKSTSLRDVSFKFAVAKRIQQLSGNVLTDNKLSTVTTVNGLLGALIRPPRPAKLAEEIEARGMLKLPNVTVYNRRVTPIDKDKMVGRWKVVERELEKRGLPVTGKGKHGRPLDVSWVRGGV